MLSPGSTFAGYEVESVVGLGGIGILYRARQLRLDRPVALKVVEPEIARDPRFQTNKARVENRAAMRAALEERLAARPAGEWAQSLAAARVPAGVVNDIAAAFELARRLGLEPVVSIEREDGTTIGLARNPIRLSATPPSYRSAPPRFKPPT